MQKAVIQNDSANPRKFVSSWSEDLFFCLHLTLRKYGSQNVTHLIFAVWVALKKGREPLFYSIHRRNYQKLTEFASSEK